MNKLKGYKSKWTEEDAKIINDSLKQEETEKEMDEFCKLFGI